MVILAYIYVYTLQGTAAQLFTQVHTTLESATRIDVCKTGWSFSDNCNTTFCL